MCAKAKKKKKKKNSVHTEPSTHTDGSHNRHPRLRNDPFGERWRRQTARQRAQRKHNDRAYNTTHNSKKNKLNKADRHDSNVCLSEPHLERSTC